MVSRDSWASSMRKRTMALIRTPLRGDRWRFTTVSLIGFAESVQLKSCMDSSRTPIDRIEFGGTVIGKYRAQAVAQSSSRGPSLTNPVILKPDIIAPRVNIIAACLKTWVLLASLKILKEWTLLSCQGLQWLSRTLVESRLSTSRLTPHGPHSNFSRLVQNKELYEPEYSHTICAIPWLGQPFMAVLVSLTKSATVPSL